MCVINVLYLHYYVRYAYISDGEYIVTEAKLLDYVVVLFIIIIIIF